MSPTAHPAPRPSRRDPARGTLTIEQALEFAKQQVQRLISTAPGAFPTYTEGGRWVLGADPWAPTWSGGFLTGLLWIFAQRTGEPWWRQQAEHYCRLLEPHQHDTSTHDLGFILEPSWGRWHDDDATPHARRVLITGGRTMAGRLQPAGGYLSSWVDPGSTFIDIMMNVGIVFRAADYTGDQTLHEVAMRHCRTTRRYLLRGDGSTLHEGWFDPDTGEFLRAGTHQGWRPDSSWARGQAWAIYGFDDAYRHTGDPQFLDAARRAADYFIERTGEPGVPPNDWDEPEPALSCEASAAAIAASGMLRLGGSLASDQTASRYRGYARRILATLCSRQFMPVDSPRWEGILCHATYHARKGLGVDESVMFGDYYLVEALDHANRLDSAVVDIRESQPDESGLAPRDRS